MIICWEKKKNAVMLLQLQQIFILVTLLCINMWREILCNWDAAVIPGIFFLYILSRPGKILAARFQAGLCKVFLNRFSLREGTEFPNYHPQH